MTFSKAMQAYGVDTNEMEGELTEYETLNEFFTRRLRPECRPLQSPGYRHLGTGHLSCRVLRPKAPEG